MAKFLPSKIVVVGDCHVDENQSLRRFDWLGHYLSTIDFDTLILMGDFLTLNSLSNWDRDKRLLMEDRRLFKEIEAGNAALDRLCRFGEDGGWGEVSREDRRNSSKDPRRIYIEGNHERRLPRYVETHPELSDTAFTVGSLLHLGPRRFEWVEYTGSVSIGGIRFLHIPFGKAKEISGADICSKAIAVTVDSTVFAHTHELHVGCVHKHGMKHLQQVLNAGCYFEKSEEYVEGKMTNYWKGIIVLNNYSYGRFDIETVSMSRLKALYEAHA